MHEEHFMVHRDLHWGNWMLLENNDVKLIDFGLAFVLGKNGFAKDYWMPDVFAPPELAREEGSDFVADVWYLACTFYSLVHPNCFSTHSKRVFNIIPGPSNANLGITMRLKIMAGKPHNPMPAGYEEFNPLFNRMLHLDPKKRANIAECI